MSSHRFDGTKLKAFREQKAWSQKGLAHELNLNLKDIDEKITDRHIRRWENEGVKPRPKILLGLALALDCETDDFFAPMLPEETPVLDADAGRESLKEQVCSFKDYIEERTKGFVGRQFIFDAIDDFVGNNECGYFFILGDPGIGKSAVAAQLVKNHKYIHHFNIRAEGINRAETFLRNICAQLVMRFELPYQTLPPDAGTDGGFLSKLLEEAGQKLSDKEKLIILIDALDEVDESSARLDTNLLFLPPILPKGVFFVITGRPQPYQLRLECSQDRLNIEHDEDDNLYDIEEYLKKKVKLRGIRSYIRKQKLTTQDFISIMRDKSDGNFMYLRYVLPEIEGGAYKNLEFKNLPVGLQNYYEDHWRRMGMMMKPLPERKIKIVYILSEVLEPVSRALIAVFTKEDQIHIQKVLDEWEQFLHKQPIEGEMRYSVYHSSFRDFLNRKDIVKAAGVSIGDINNMIMEGLLDLYEDKSDPTIKD